MVIVSFFFVDLTIFNIHVVTPIKLKRTRVKYILGASIDIPSYDTIKDDKLIRGLDATLNDITSAKIESGADGDGPYQEITVPDKFPPGSIMLFSTQIEGLDPRMDDLCKQGVETAFSGLDLMDLNVILHRCDGEERDATSKDSYRSFFVITYTP